MNYLTACLNIALKYVINHSEEFNKGNGNSLLFSVKFYGDVSKVLDEFKTIF